MAQSTVPYSSAPLRPSQRPAAAPNPAAVLAYAATHTNAETAARFGINERSVRRIKARARTRASAEDRQLGTREEPNSLTALSLCDSTVESHNAGATGSPEEPVAFPPTADDIAGEHTSWKCPATGELLPVIPGARRKAWEQERREAHARHVAAVTHAKHESDPGSNSSGGSSLTSDSHQLDPVTNSPQGASNRATLHGSDPRETFPQGETVDTRDRFIGGSVGEPPIAYVTLPGPDTAPISSARAETGGQVRSALPFTPMPGPVPVRVIRVPVEPAQPLIVRLWQDHEVARKQALGLVVLLALIAATWIG